MRGAEPVLAVSLPCAPLSDRSVVESCAPLLTSLGLRSLDPADPAYLGRRRGVPAARPYAEAALKTGADTDGRLDGREAHLSEWGLGSVSETADEDAPHAATGCPFQAWSVAETLRERRCASAGCLGR